MNVETKIEVTMSQLARTDRTTTQLPYITYVLTLHNGSSTPVDCDKKFKYMFLVVPVLTRNARAHDDLERRKGKKGGTRTTAQQATHLNFERKKRPQELALSQS
jgi:hypothetical protein